MKPTIRAMQIREAKDFLVAQTSEQAALEGVSLSDLEKRMMYFTEGPDAVEDPVMLNEEFESQYNSVEYEKKMALLLAHAYERIKKGNPQAVSEWDAAINKLREGDHYLLVLWGRLSLGSYMRILMRLVALVSITMGLCLVLRYLLRPLGVSLISFLFFLFVVTGIAVTLKPQPLGTYLERAALQIFVFLIGRRKSNNST
jgi:hypothetical protein